MKLQFEPPTNADPHQDYLVSYKTWLSQQPVTPNTVRVYHSRIKQFLLFLKYRNLNNHRLDNANGLEEAIRLYLDFLKESKATGSSMNANLNALNNFTLFMGFQPAPIKRQQCSHQSAATLAPHEQAAFLGSVERQKSSRDRALALVLFHTGLRIGDCAGLKARDISIDRNSSANQTNTCINLGNGGKVQLNESTTLALRQWLEERQEIRDVETTPGLWLTREGQQLSISGIAFVIRRIGWQARVMVSAEILRRTRLATTSSHLNKQLLASKFGSYVSSATIDRCNTISVPESTYIPDQAMIGKVI